MNHFANRLTKRFRNRYDETVKRILWIALFLYLVAFSFGQFTRVPFPFLPGEVSLYLTDLIVGVIGVVGVVWGKNKITPLDKTFFLFLISALFSLILASASLSLNQILISGLYLIRLLFYGLFFSTVYNLIQNDKEKKLVLNSLVLVGCVTAIGGLIQYFLFPDLRALLFFGWDEHVDRIVGTMFDPNFTSIILVFTLLLIISGSCHEFSSKKTHKGTPSWRPSYSCHPLILLTVFFALLFTYSRSGYLAFVVGLSVYSIILKTKSQTLFMNIRIAMMGIVLLALGVYLLPKQTSEGTKLARTTSINLRMENLKEGVELFKAHPLFGVGFNTLRYTREPQVEKYGPSHAASGIDNSFLFILATTGLVGFVAFMNLMGEVIKRSLGSTGSVVIIIPTLAALSVHSLFVNSFFYPWVLGWLALLLAASLRTNKR